MRRLPEKPVYLYSKDYDELKALVALLKELQISMYSTSSEFQLNLGKVYSLYIFSFESLDELQEYKVLFSPPSSNSVIVHLVPRDLDWTERDLADIIIEKNSEPSQEYLKIALELAYLRETEEKFLIGSDDHSENTGVKNKSKFVIQKKSIYSLTTSLSQGSGFGTSVTLIDMIDFMKKDGGDHYAIDKELIHLLVENNVYSRNLLDGLQSMVRLLGASISLHKTPISQFIDELPIALKGIASHFSKKQMELVIKKEYVEGSIEINRETIYLLTEELLLNAFKYSMLGSKVELDLTKDKASFIIRFRNQVHPEFYGGVPPELESVVREPFIRIYPPGDEPLTIVKFGLGLGLTAIDYIVNQHNGSFTIRDEFIPTEMGHDNFVVAEVFLPIID